MSNDKVQLTHPEGKKLPRIERQEYELIHDQILKILNQVETIKPMQLLNQIAEDLAGQMEGSIAWWAESVKLDMEAKRELTHDRKKGLIKKAKEKL